MGSSFHKLVSWFNATKHTEDHSRSNFLQIQVFNKSIACKSDMLVGDNTSYEIVDVYVENWSHHPIKGE